MINFTSFLVKRIIEVILQISLNCIFLAQQWTGDDISDLNISPNTYGVVYTQWPIAFKKVIRARPGAMHGYTGGFPVIFTVTSTLNGPANSRYIDIVLHIVNVHPSDPTTRVSFLLMGIGW